MVFKCRLCEGIVEVPINHIKAKELCDRIMGVSDGFTPVEEPKQIHKCANGNRGIMDLIGFSLCQNE